MLLFLFKKINSVHNIKGDIMTQKELLYVEDAVKHETSIIKILNESLEFLEDDKLITFIEEEINKHKDLKQGLLNLLEDETNE